MSAIYEGIDCGGMYKRNKDEHHRHRATLKETIVNSAFQDEILSISPAGITVSTSVWYSGHCTLHGLSSTFNRDDQRADICIGEHYISRACCSRHARCDGHGVCVSLNPFGTVVADKHRKT